MMLTFHLTGRCQGCRAEVRGFQFDFPKRINLSSIITERSLIVFDPCRCDRNQPQHPMEVIGDARLDEESAAVVEAARARIRARRKPAAAA